MAVRFKILGSSSSGNCGLLQTDDCKVLIDAGFSGRRITEMLEASGESIDGIDAVFLTHEHNDHVAGLPGLSRYRKLTVFANRFTSEAVRGRLKNEVAWRVFETGTRFEFRDLTVDAFPVPHDAHDPVGFVFSTGGKDLFNPHRSLAWVLDLGYLPEVVRERIRRVDLLVIEANHDRTLLRDHLKRPWSLKQRISGRHGHLCNETACEFVENSPDARWKRVCLAHLSRDCNSVEQVEQAFTRSRKGAFPHELSVIAPDAGTPFYDFP